MREKEKTTVPIPSVGADGEQSLSYVAEEIVAQEPDYFNFDDGKHGEEYLKQMLRMSEPSYLPTMTMNQIYETVYESRRPIIENLLYPGAYLFVGAPKVGKSFFMAQLAYHVSVGLPLWDYNANPGTVLYLALEDDYRRIQERLYRMFGVDAIIYPNNWQEVFDLSPKYCRFQCDFSKSIFIIILLEFRFDEVSYVKR